MNRTFNFGEWLPWEQNASPFLLTLTLNAGMNDLRAYFGMPLWTTLILFEENQGKWLFRPKELKVLGQKMIDFLMCPPLRVAFFGSFDDAEADLLEEAKTVQFSIDVKALSNAELSTAFKELETKYYAWYKFGWFCEPIQFQAQDLIAAFLEKEVPNLPEGMSASDAKQYLFALEQDSFAIGILKHLQECSLALESTLKSKKLGQDLLREAGADNFPQLAASKVMSAIERDNSADLDMLDRTLKEHQQNFYWKKNNYFSTTFLTAQDILEEIFGSAGFDLQNPTVTFSRELEQTKINKEKSLESKKTLISLLTPYYRNLIGLVGTVGGSLLDRRKRVIMIVNAAVDRILKEVAARTSMTIENIRCLIPQELAYFLDSPQEYKERLTDRRKLFIVFQADFPLVSELAADVLANVTNKEFQFDRVRMADPFLAEGEHANKVVDQLNLLLNFLKSTSSEGGDRVEGVVIYFDPQQPVVEGVVRVIKDPKSENLRTGEILVAPSTTPDYMDAIRRAKAIVTDWGGQTSHAAITSRELSKPCIIGTNFASQILKTGDRVRINFADATIEKLQE
jgi:phosphohistidine swiveling domain-containing protein